MKYKFDNVQQRNSFINKMNSSIIVDTISETEVEATPSVNHPVLDMLIESAYDLVVSETKLRRKRNNLIAAIIFLLFCVFVLMNTKAVAQEPMDLDHYNICKVEPYLNLGVKFLPDPDKKRFKIHYAGDQDSVILQITDINHNFLYQRVLTPSIYHYYNVDYYGLSYVYIIIPSMSCIYVGRPVLTFFIN